MNADSEVEMYTVKEGNELIQYYMKSQSGQEAGSWMHTKSGDYALGTAEKLDVSEILEACSEMQDMFSDLKLQKDTVDYNNVNCYLMDGTIKGEKLAEFIREQDLILIRHPLKHIKRWILKHPSISRQKMKRLMRWW